MSCEKKAPVPDAMLLDTGNFTTCSICQCCLFLMEFVFVSSCNTTCAVTTHIIASRHDTYLVSVRHPGKEAKWKCLKQHNTRCQLVFYLHLLSFVLALPFSMSLYEVNCKPDMSPEHVVTARRYSWGFIFLGGIVQVHFGLVFCRKLSDISSTVGKKNFGSFCIGLLGCIWI